MQDLFDDSFFDFADARQNKKIRELNRRLRDARRDSSRGRAELSDEVEMLEEALGRSLLLLHALVKVCLEKGVLTQEELAQAAEQLDLSDGQRDQKLDPLATIPADKRPDPRPPSVQEHLRQLENTDAQGPQEFLKDLEDDE